MNLLFLCTKIFFARILDVSIGTIRTLIMVKGKLFLTSILAFLEVLIWVLVVKIYCKECGNGATMDDYYDFHKFDETCVIPELVSDWVNQERIYLIKAIRKNGFAVSVIDLKDNKNGLLLCQVNHKSEQKLIKLVKKYDENAFIIVSDTKYVQNGFIK